MTRGGTHLTAATRGVARWEIKESQGSERSGEVLLELPFHLQHRILRRLQLPAERGDLVLLFLQWEMELGRAAEVEVFVLPARVCSSA